VTVIEAIEQLQKLPENSQVTIPGRIIRIDDQWSASWIGAEEIKVEDGKVRIW
jgi:hypothetical protein